MSHEAVIWGWERLVEWAREAHEDLRFLQVIRKNAAEWQCSGHSVDWLYRGMQLAQALAWRERSLLSRDEEAFLTLILSQGVNDPASPGSGFALAQGRWTFPAKSRR